MKINFHNEKRMIILYNEFKDVVEMKKIAIFFIFLFLGLTSSCAKQETKENYTFYAMDTIISITFYNVKDSKELAKDVENIYLYYQNIADDFAESEGIKNVYSLNLQREAEISDELKELLEFALQMMVETNGYYNPFIGRLSHLWKDALDQAKIVDEAIVQEELIIMQHTTLEFEEKHVRMIGEGNLDLGGVAKGYATNKAKEYLDSKNCTSYLLNAGSSNLVLGDKNGQDFIVGLSKALGTGYFETLQMKNICVSTSSIKEQHTKIDGEYYSHLLNPKTGYPAMFYETLSIVGEDSGVLDAYSTAGFAMELEELKQFLEKKGLDFIVSKENKTLYKSIGINAYEKN